MDMPTNAYALNLSMGMLYPRITQSKHLVEWLVEDLEGDVEDDEDGEAEIVAGIAARPEALGGIEEAGGGGRGALAAIARIGGHDVCTMYQRTE